VTSPPLQQFLDLRTSVSQRRLGNGGTDVCEALTTSLDAAIKDLAESMGPDTAVVALGGYGRREQRLGSDDQDRYVVEGRLDRFGCGCVLRQSWSGSQQRR
jgi:hypothetical protein